MTTIQACVNPRLLTKASRLFTGTLDGRVTELLQNARRAGATRGDIINQDGHVTVRDNGAGIDDFAKLLDLGGSGWEEEFEASEDPAGVGLFCLAPREVCIRSRGQAVRIAGRGWRGHPVEVEADSDGTDGTMVSFQDEQWSRSSVESLAVFSGLAVTVDGEPCTQDSFVGDTATHSVELGCRIEVREPERLSPWHRCARRSHGYCDNALVNFHGQTTSFDCHPVSEHGLWFLVDLTGEPTDIRLMLPARTQLVENDAFAQLKAALELEAYRYLQRRGHHRLPYKQYLRAKALGIELPEALPTIEVGLLHTCDNPQPLAVMMPEKFPLAQCYRFDPDCAGSDADEINAHLLAALGTLTAPFVPVHIRGEYDGYSWAALPTVGTVILTRGRQLHSAGVWSGQLTCVDTLTIAVQTSDGKSFSSPVCLAKSEPAADGSYRADDEMLVTPDAEGELPSDALWYHLGGWHDEGDTYDTQSYDFQRELESFWADLVGPNEQLRRSILAPLDRLGRQWKTVTVHGSGKVQIVFQRGAPRTLQLPKPRTRIPEGRR
jgi:hypothetical protein